VTKKTFGGAGRSN